MWAWFTVVLGSGSALAEPWPDLDPAHAAELVAAISPGDVLLRWCAACEDGVSVVRVRGATRADGLRSEGEQIRLDWEVLATASASADPADFEAPVCAVASVCLPGPVPGCASDLGFFDATSTWRLDAEGRWMPLRPAGASPEDVGSVLPVSSAWTAQALACPGVRPAPDLLPDAALPLENPPKRKSRRRPATGP